MGFRFRRSRRSFKVFPGVRINTGKKGINSVSIGGKGKIFGATTNINLKTGKARHTYSLKGIGSIVHTPNSSTSNTSKASRRIEPSVPTPTPAPEKPKARNLITPKRLWYQNPVLVGVLAIIMPPVGIP